MKKILIAALLSLAAASTFANTQLIRSTAEIGQPVAWEFTKDDGLVFLLGPESKNYLVISVDPQLKNGLPTDPVDVRCNQSTYHLTGGETATCYGNFNDVIYVETMPAEFKNGTQGTYTYFPLGK